jgi:predicted amidohydrolase
MPADRKRWRAAAIQMTSTDDVPRNLDLAERLVRKAASAGADLVALPENFAFLLYEGGPVRFAEPREGRIVTRMRGLARELGIHLLLGSIPEKVPRQRRVFNTSLLLGPTGRILAAYRKVHLFDIDIPGGVTLMESKNVAPGEGPVVVRTPLGRLGLSICYDLRFPELYRREALAGAQVLFVPAAFTAFTGPHHWLPLLRARAIENLCWVVAPTQVGRHNEHRESHGEVAIVDPWGRVVARRAKAQGYVEATIDLEEVERIRRGLPCLRHVRRDLFRFPARRR